MVSPLSVARSLRPEQWVKNGLLLAAIVFSERYTDLPAVRSVGLGIVFFSMLASAGYLVNDLRDVEQDRMHPSKKNRPIAAGSVPVPLGWVLAAILMAGGLAGSFWINRAFGITAATYLVVTLSYSTWFKHVVILDVMLLSAGFILRAVAGAVAIPVAISPWFLTCTAFGALFIGMSKRLAEIRLLEGDAGAHRKILEEYSESLLEKWIGIVTACTLISYALYTFEAGRPRAMMLTIPFVLYGVLRFLYLNEQKGMGGSPTGMLLEDRAMQLCIALFGVTAILALRFG